MDKLKDIVTLEDNEPERTIHNPDALIKQNNKKVEEIKKGKQVRVKKDTVNEFTHIPNKKRFGSGRMRKDRVERTFDDKGNVTGKKVIEFGK